MLQLRWMLLIGTGGGGMVQAGDCRPGLAASGDAQEEVEAAIIIFLAKG